YEPPSCTFEPRRNSTTRSMALPRICEPPALSQKIQSLCSAGKRARTPARSSMAPRIAYIPRMPPSAPDAARVLVGTPESLLAACRADMQRARQGIKLLYGMTAPRDPQAALQAYDEAMGALGDAAARASVCRNAHPDSKMRDAADQCEQEVDALATELSLDRGVYDTLAAIDIDGADAATKYYVQKTLRDLRRAGVDKDDATRARVRTLREELLKIGQEFGKNIKDDVRTLAIDPSELDGLPDDFKQQHKPGADGKVTISTDNTDYIPFVTYAKSSKAREALWRLYRL